MLFEDYVVVLIHCKYFIRTYSSYPQNLLYSRPKNYSYIYSIKLMMILILTFLCVKTIYFLRLKYFAGCEQQVSKVYAEQLHRVCAGE